MQHLLPVCSGCEEPVACHNKPCYRPLWSAQNRDTGLMFDWWALPPPGECGESPRLVCVESPNGLLWWTRHDTLQCPKLTNTGVSKCRAWPSPLLSTGHGQLKTQMCYKLRCPIQNEVHFKTEAVTQTTPKNKLTLNLMINSAQMKYYRLAQPERCKGVHRHIKRKHYLHKIRSLLTWTRFSLRLTRIPKMYQNKHSRLATPKLNVPVMLAARTNKCYCLTRLKLSYTLQKNNRRKRIRIKAARPSQVGGKQSYSKQKANERKITRIQAEWPSQVGRKQSYSKQKANERKRTRIQDAWPSQVGGKQSYSNWKANKGERTRIQAAWCMLLVVSSVTQSKKPTKKKVLECKPGWG